MSTLGDLRVDLTSGDNERAERAAVAFPQHGKGSIEVLKELLKSKIEDERWWATRALAEFKEIEASGLLINTLTDPAVSVRYCAALSLSQRPHPAAVPKLIEILGNEDGLFTRLSADALVTAGAAAVEPLIAALDAGTPNARVEAARALALIGDTRAVPALFKLLDSDSIILQHWANEGLERMGVGMSFFKP